MDVNRCITYYKKGSQTRNILNYFNSVSDNESLEDLLFKIGFVDFKIFLLQLDNK